MCDTYNCDYLQHSKFRFSLINFQLNTDFPSQFCTVKSPSVTQRSVSQENAFKRAKTRRLFLVKLYSQIMFYSCYDSQIWIQGNSTLKSMSNAPSCGPLTDETLYVGSSTEGHFTCSPTTPPPHHRTLFQTHNHLPTEDTFNDRGRPASWSDRMMDITKGLRLRASWSSMRFFARDYSIKHFHEWTADHRLATLC